MNTTFFRLPGTRLLAVTALIGAAAVALPGAARAQNYTWDGAGAGDNWSDLNNWLNNIRPSSNAASQITFAGPTRLTPNQNLVTPFTLNALIFDSSAGAFTLGGGALNFQTNGGAAPTITQASANLQIVSSALTLSANLTANITGVGGLTLNGAISGGTQSLTKSGGSLLTLAGDNTFTGGLTVNTGRVTALNNGKSLGGGGVGINNGAVVELAATTVSTNVLVAGGTSFTGAGTLVKSGSGTVSFGDGGGGGNVNVSLGAGGLIDVQGGTLNGSSSNQGVWTNNLASLSIAAGATFNGVEGTIFVNSLIGAGTLRGGYQGTNTITVGVNGGSGTFSGVIADNTAQGGVLALTKAGTATLILTGANTYSGTTTISAGTVRVGNNGTTGTLGSGPVVNNAELNFIRTDAITVANVISGSGSLLDFSGGLTLTGANTYSGGTDLITGRLGAGNDTALGTGPLSVDAAANLFAAGADHALGNAIGLTGGTLTVVADATGAHNLALNGAMTGGYGLTVNAAGTIVTLGGAAANTFTGQTSVPAGTLGLNKNSNVAALGGNLAIGNAGADPAAGTPAGGVVQFTSDRQTTSATSVVVQGNGLFDVNNHATTIGALTLNGGEARLGAGTLTLSGDVSVGASTAGARITSTDSNNDLNLSAAARTFTVADGAARYDLDVTAGLTNGTLVKAGAGTLRLAGGINSALAVTLNAGTLALASDAALGSSGGTFTLAGGTVVADGGDRTVSNAVNLTGNATVGASLDGAASGLAFVGVVSGAGGIVKNGTGTLTLGNTGNTFTGGLTLNGGTLAVAGDGSLGGPGGVVTLNGGSLQFTGSATTARTFNLPNAVTLGTAAGTTLSLGNGAGVNGGFLSAGGTLAFTGGSALNGTTALIGSTLTQSGAVAFNNATLRGTLTQAATGAILTATSGLNVAGSGTLTANGTVNLVNGGESLGRLVVNPGATVNVQGNALYLDAGSRTAIGSVGAPGGALAAATGTSVELAGLLVNNGAQTGVLNVHFGGLAKGGGAFGTVNVTDGGRFSPGNSPATVTAEALTLGAGSRYDFEATDTAADLLNVSGTLTLDAGTTANSRFVVDLFTLDGSNNPAMLTRFDPSQPRTFLLATAAGGILGFDPNAATVDRTGFLNDTQGGSFAVLQRGNNLVIQFMPVPEPTTWACLAAGAMACATAIARRRAGQ